MSEEELQLHVIYHSKALNIFSREDKGGMLNSWLGPAVCVLHISAAELTKTVISNWSCPAPVGYGRGTFSSKLHPGLLRLHQLHKR